MRRGSALSFKKTEEGFLMRMTAEEQRRMGTCVCLLCISCIIGSIIGGLIAWLTGIEALWPIIGVPVMIGLFILFVYIIRKRNN